MVPVHLSLAAKADRGEISKEDMDVQLSQALFAVQQEQARTNAALLASRAAVLQGAAAMMNATRPAQTIYVAPCTIYGQIAHVC
jgi:hypothetical protein